MELDQEKQRFLVTLRCSDLQLSEESFSFSDWSKSLLSEFESYQAGNSSGKPSKYCLSIWKFVFASSESVESLEKENDEITIQA